MLGGEEKGFLFSPHDAQEAQGSLPAILGQLGSMKGHHLIVVRG